MNWFSNFYGRVQNPLPIARDPFDNAVIKAAVANLGKEFWFRTKRAERIMCGLKQKAATSVQAVPTLPKPTPPPKLPKPAPTPNPNSYGAMRKKMLEEL